MEHLSRRLAFLAAAIVFTLVTGTLGFILIEHYPPFDAFYMTLITITNGRIRGNASVKPSRTNL